MQTPESQAGAPPEAAGSIASVAAAALAAMNPTPDVPAASSDGIPDVPAASSTATPDVPAASSAADVERKTLLEVAREAIAPAKDAQASSSQPAVDPKAADQATPQDAAAETTPPNADTAAESETPAAKDDDYSDVPFGKHPRWKQMRAELQELRGLRPAAEQYEKVQAFMDEHGLQAEQVAQGYTLMAMAQRAQRGDKQAAQLFLKEIEPLRSLFLELTGDAVSEDLRPRVEAAELDESTAKSLTQARAENRALEADRRAREEAAQEQARAETVGKIRSAVTEWDAQTRSRDPDYSSKEPLVIERMKAIVAAEGAPASPQDAVKLAERAYKDTNERLSVFVPKPRPTTPTPPAAGASRPSALPPPTSLREVAERALASSRS